MNKSFSTKLDIKRIISTVLVIIAVFSLVWSYLCGFRWPSDFVLTNHVITYIYGFVPRGIIGEIGYLIFRDNWYSGRIISAIIILVAAVFVIWTIVLVIKSGYMFNNPLFFTLMISFAFSPASKYYLHEMGYYEQYGYLFIVLLFSISNKKNKVYNFILCPVLGFISILISETNMFLIVPILIAFSLTNFVPLVANNRDLRKKLINLCLLYIPHLIYCICVWIIKVPKDSSIRLQEHDRSMVNNGFPYKNFAFREDVHLYLSGDRSNKGIYPRELHLMHIWCFSLIIMMIMIVAFIMLIEKNNKNLIVTYIISSVGVGICAYIVCVIAWDIERFYFNSYMSVFLYTLYFVKENLSKLKLTFIHGFIIALFLCAFLGMSNNRFGLFDGATYNENIYDFIDVLNMDSIVIV